MTAKILTIAHNTFREAVRSRILYAILFFAVLLLVSSLVFGELSLHQQERVIKDLGLVVITLFSAMISIIIGVSLVHKEIDKKTIYTIVSKPVERWQFLVGKYFGILLTMFVQLTIMGGLFTALLLIRGIEFQLNLFQAMVLVYLEVMVISAAALMFSAFSSPFLSGMMTASLFLLGNVYQSMMVFAESSADPLTRGVLRIAQIFLPDFSLYNISQEVTYNLPVYWNMVGYAALHSVTYAAVLILVASVVLHRRDFI